MTVKNVNLFFSRRCVRRRHKVFHGFPCIFHGFPCTSTTFRVGYAVATKLAGMWLYSMCSARLFEFDHFAGARLLVYLQPIHIDPSGDGLAPCASRPSQVSSCSPAGSGPVHTSAHWLP